MMPDTLSIGTTVYVPQIETKKIRMPCPDCNDEGKWSISTPAGLLQLEITCPRCHGDKHGYDWLLPVRYERTVEIREGKIIAASVHQRKSHSSDDVHEHISYDTAPYLGSLPPAKVFTSRDAAEAAGAEMMIADAKRERSEWDMDRKRDEARAGLDIIQAFDKRANERAKKLDDKIEALREKMLEAIQYPSLDGPKITQKTGGGPELTPQNLAEWLNKLLEEADIETMSEEQIREATCDCA